MQTSLALETIADGETERLVAHFDWVLTLLRAQGTTPGGEQGARRERTLELLEGYVGAREFPRNIARRDRMLPAFIDDRGVHCAVAHLMVKTDAHALSRRIADTMNLAYVGEMVEVLPGEIAEWARSLGLTPAEVALIQPSYCPDSGDPCIPLYEQCDEQGSCECRPYELEDGVECFADEEVGVCKELVCVSKTDGEPLEEESGCSAGPEGAHPAGPAAMLAALFLISVARRSRMKQ